jgi:thymidylate synthase ThyX
MDSALEAYRALCDSDELEAKQSAQYLLPMGMKCRAMFKMDFAEALYIAELRSGIAGHFSYRKVAWEMYRAIAKRHPALAALFRIEDVNVPVDLLKR